MYLKIDTLIYKYIHMFLHNYIYIYTLYAYYVTSLPSLYISMLFLPRTFNKKNTKATIFGRRKEQPTSFSWKVSSFEKLKLGEPKSCRFGQGFFYPPWNDLTYPLPLNPGTFESMIFRTSRLVGYVLRSLDGKCLAKKKQCG